MIILRQKNFGFPKGLIPFYNTFKNIGNTGKSLYRGDFKGAGKNILKSVGTASIGVGKIAGAGVGTVGLGLYGIESGLNNSMNDMEEKFNYHYQ